MKGWPWARATCDRTVQVVLGTSIHHPWRPLRNSKPYGRLRFRLRGEKGTMSIKWKGINNSIAPCEFVQFVYLSWSGRLNRTRAQSHSTSRQTWITKVHPYLIVWRTRRHGTSRTRRLQKRREKLIGSKKVCPFCLKSFCNLFTGVNLLRVLLRTREAQPLRPAFGSVVFTEIDNWKKAKKIYHHHDRHRHHHQS